jgi:hypothetical protein
LGSTDSFNAEARRAVSTYECEILAPHGYGAVHLSLVGRRTVNAELAILPSNELRSATRRIIDFGAFVREEDATALKVRCRDISTDGCRIEGAAGLAPDAAIWISRVARTR